MSVYKPKKSSVWHYDFVIGGVRHHGSTRQTERGAAEKYEGIRRGEALKATLFPGEKKRPRLALKAAFGRYWEEVSQHTASKDTDLTATGKLLSLGADTDLSDIDDGIIARWVAKRRGEFARYRRVPVSNATVNREIELLRRVFRRAKDLWKVEVGDDRQWGRHRLPEADGRIRELSDLEEAALLAKLREDYRPMVEFALATGLRLTNVLTLTWFQVDLRASQVTVKMKSRRPGGKVHVVPLTPLTRTLLANEAGKHPTRVFTYVPQKQREKRKRRVPQPFTENGWRKAWRSALDAAGIIDFRFHDLRHTAATRLVREEGNIGLAKKLLGHSSIVSTARYIHATQDDLRTALVRVESRKTPEPQSAVDIAKPRTA